MYYKTKTRAAKPVRRRYKLSGFKGYDSRAVTSTLPCDYTGECINFGFKDGRLTAGVGVDRLKIRELDGSLRSLVPEFRYPKDEKPCMLAGFNCGYVNDNYFDILIFKEKEMLDCPFSNYLKTWFGFPLLNSDCKTGVNYLTREGKHIYIISGSEEGVRIFDGFDGFDWVKNALKVKYMCVHAERVFAIVEDDDYAIWFCDAFDPYNWDVSLDAGGYLRFDGSLGIVRRLFGFSDYLYVFCDYGIYRVGAYGDQSAFTVRRVYAACGKIYPLSIVEAGDRLIFMAEDGVYSFDGYDVTLLTDRLSPLLHDGDMNFSAAYCKHTYYISMYCRTDDSSPMSGDNNRLIAIDTRTGNIDIADMSVYSLYTIDAPAQNEVMALRKGLGQVLVLDSSGLDIGKVNTRRWKISGVDMGEPDNLKVIRSIESNSATPYTLVISSDRGETCRTLVQAGAGCVKVNIKGKSFDFTITSDSEVVDISPPYITVDMYGGGL
ncbi:MAG: hypothetical protein K2M44_05910 [Clostridia bacterium]|nr:hypothetical protein [Clostridia bacterium]